MNDTTTSSSGAPRRRRKSRKGLIFSVAVLVAAGGGWYGWTAYKASKAREGEYMTAPVTMGSIEDLVTSTGALEPRDYVDVGAQVSGQIQELLVEIGDVVTKGQDLVKIDAESAQARMEQSEIQLATAKNNLDTQRENLKKTERDFQRQKNLLEQDATTRQAVLDAETSYENAKRQIRSSELSIANQEASMRIEKRNLNFTTIKAPIDGTVMSIAVKLGQTVNASQSVPNVLRIADLTTMTVKSEVSEADVGKLYAGIPVYFTTLSGGNRRWYGELRRIEPTPKVQNSVVLYNALFEVQNEDNSLKASSTAQVYFVGAEARDVLLVPMAALTQGQQIQRELAQKEREKNGGKAVAGPGAGGPPGAPGAGPGAAGNTAAATRNGADAGADAPAAAAVSAPATPGNAAAGTAPGTQQANAQGNRPAGNAQGNRQRDGQGNAQGGRPGQGGGFNGQRPGGNAQAGAGGQRGGFGGGGFNMQNMTPEQREQMMARVREGGGFGGQRGGFNGPRPGGAMNAAAARNVPAAGPRPVQQRRGTVMVKKADGTLEARPVVVGVTDRVLGQVISGLSEGEEVVVAKRETEAAAAAPRQNNNNNFQQGNRGGGGFPGGGRGF